MPFKCPACTSWYLEEEERNAIMNRADLQQLSEMRLREAQALLSSGNPCGAYYMAGFAVECGLKACIARKTRQFDFPDKRRASEAFEHSAEKLVRVAELKLDLDTEEAANPDFAAFWVLVKGWNVERRYETTTTYQEAADLIRAIDDPTNGVLRWLKNYW